MKKPLSKTLKIVLTVLVSVLVCGVAFGAVIALSIMGNPVIAVLFAAVFLIIFVVPTVARRALSAIAAEAAEASAAVGNGKVHTVDKGWLAGKFILSFLPFWLIVPVFLLLPGAIGIFPVIPGTVIAAVRMAKVYPYFEDLGVPRRRYRLFHFLAYIAAFAAFLALKLVLNL